MSVCEKHNEMYSGVCKFCHWEAKEHASSGNSGLLSELENLLLKWVETMERNQRFEKEQESLAAGIMVGAQAKQILDVHFLLEKYR